MFSEKPPAAGIRDLNIMARRKGGGGGGGAGLREYSPPTFIIECEYV